MQSTTLARPGAETRYEVMLRASIATRFKQKDRSIIAASVPDEAAARHEFALLCQEFPGPQISLRLLRCRAELPGQAFREQLLDRREPVVQQHDKRGLLRPAAHPRRPRPLAERPKVAQSASSPVAKLHWRLALAVLALSILLGLLLR